MVMSITHIVNMHEAKTNLSKLVARAHDGDEVIIARAGQPVARIVAYSAPTGARRFGALHGVIPHISAADWEQSDRDMAQLWGL